MQSQVHTFVFLELACWASAGVLRQVARRHPPLHHGAGAGVRAGEVLSIRAQVPCRCSHRCIPVCSLKWLVGFTPCIRETGSNDLALNNERVMIK